MTLFDHKTRQLRAPRVKKLLTTPPTAGADFLLRRAAEGVAERLGDVKRDFTRALVAGTGHGAFAAALPPGIGIAETDAADDRPGVARAPDDAPAIGEGGFDLAVSGMVLHRVDDPVGLLTQLRLALKPDGLLLAALFGGRTLHELRAAFAEAEAEVEGGLSPRVAPMGEIRDLGGLLQRAGLAMPVADVDRIDVTYETPFHLMRDLRAMGEANPMTARRRSFTRRATMLRMAEIYAANYPAPGGRVAATFEIVYLTGWSPDASQPQPLRPGSATARLADALGTEEKPAGEKTGR